MATEKERNLTEKTDALRALFSSRAKIIAATVKLDADHANDAGTMAELESAAAAELSSENPVKTLFTKLLGLRDSMELARLTRNGLQSRLAGVEREIGTAVSAFEAARLERNKELISAFLPEFLKAAGQFGSVLKKGAALAEGLGERSASRPSRHFLAPYLAENKIVTEPSARVTEARHEKIA
jgi:hypothetical protein